MKLLYLLCRAAYAGVLQSSKASKACQQQVKQVSRTVIVFAQQHMRAYFRAALRKLMYLVFCFAIRTHMLLCKYYYSSLLTCFTSCWHALLASLCSAVRTHTLLCKHSLHFRALCTHTRTHTHAARNTLEYHALSLSHTHAAVLIRATLSSTMLLCNFPYAHLHLHLHLHKHNYTHPHTNLYLRTHTHTNTYTHTYTYTYTYTHTHQRTRRWCMLGFPCVTHKKNEGEKTAPWLWRRGGSISSRVTCFTCNLKERKINMGTPWFWRRGAGR